MIYFEYDKYNFTFIFDLVNFGKNNYNDKNGYKLYSWKKPK